MSLFSLVNLSSVTQFNYSFCWVIVLSDFVSFLKVNNVHNIIRFRGCFFFFQACKLVIEHGNQSADDHFSVHLSVKKPDFCIPEYQKFDFLLMNGRRIIWIWLWIEIPDISKKKKKLQTIKRLNQLHLENSVAPILQKSKLNP